MRNDTCFNEQLKKEFIETVNFMVGLIPALKAENKSSNEMARLEELIKTKNEDLSSLERSKKIVKDKDTKYVISSEISKVKKTISTATEAKKNMENCLFESTEKIRLYRNYARTKWEYFKKLNFVFSKEEIEELTDEMLMGYFLFEGMGSLSSLDKTKGISCPKDNNKRTLLIIEYGKHWNTFIKWLVESVDY